MKNFFITSQGRTATKWLAWVMNQSPTWVVEHETGWKPSSSPKFGLVSPAHLRNIYQIEPQMTGVVLRDPRHCMLSACNRYQVVGDQGLREFVSSYCSDTALYYHIMNQLLERGALAIDYHRYSDLRYVQAVCTAFGVDDVVVTEKMLEKRVNTFAPHYASFDVIPRALKEVAEKDGMAFYKKWEAKAKTCIA